ncbi:MAG TPA: MBL fold metallo-hydrolase [Gemmatimonadaceae bacterium]|nr:MBL fold metallo-hydrolase [Gemmatimonadaceae bacterium]
MKILAATVGEFQENTYLVVDEATGRAIVVDPGAEPERIVKWIRASGAALDAVWLTHAHLDHVGAVAAVKREWRVPVYMHPADAPTLARAPQAAAGYDIQFEAPPAPDRELAEGDSLSVGDLTFSVMHVPGHAPGHVVFHGNGVVLGGDLLFAGSIGRTDLPLADPRAMEESLVRIGELDENLVVYPGHGPATTIGRERASNPFLLGVAHSRSR